jgi:hypothetical protein
MEPRSSGAATASSLVLLRCRPVFVSGIHFFASVPSVPESVLMDQQLVLVLQFVHLKELGFFVFYVVFG